MYSKFNNALQAKNIEYGDYKYKIIQNIVLTDTIESVQLTSISVDILR